MTTYYAAVKWPVGATRDEIMRAVASDLDMLATMLIEEHGVDLAEVRDVFENAMTAAEMVSNE